VQGQGGPRGVGEALVGGPGDPIQLDQAAEHQLAAFAQGQGLAVGVVHGGAAVAVAVVAGAQHEGLTGLEQPGPRELDATGRAVGDHQAVEVQHHGGAVGQLDPFTVGGGLGAVHQLGDHDLTGPHPRHRHRLGLNPGAVGAAAVLVDVVVQRVACSRVPRGVGVVAVGGLADVVLRPLAGQAEGPLWIAEAVAVAVHEPARGVHRILVHQVVAVLVHAVAVLLGARVAARVVIVAVLGGG
jgi:hypothetical protein